VTKETNCDQSTESGGRDSGPRRSYLISVRKMWHSCTVSHMIA